MAWFLYGLLVLLPLVIGQRDDFYYGTFPKDFMFGCATASYQIEGAWNEDGKGENIWDNFCHRDPSPIKNGDTGDIACDSYHHYQQDVQILKDMGLQHYRFSLSWARILPDGTTSSVNQAGVDFYNNIIDLLLANNITPMVTLYHWDLPQALQEQFGGWTSEQITDYFGEFARTSFSLFGDRVKLWITLNEPWVVARQGYGFATQAPGIKGLGTDEYQAAHNLIKAHARAWHIYDDEFRETQKGQIGITLNADFFEPKTNTTDNIEAADRSLQFNLGWFSHPIFSSEGDYPPVMREYVDRKSQEQGYNQSRLPVFGDEWVTYIKGTSDFFGLNHYTSSLAENGVTGEVPSLDNDMEVVLSDDPSWPIFTAKWLKVVPWGLRKLLKWIRDEYANPPLYVTENGFADTGELNDTDRINYYNLYINEVLKAVQLDSCNILGYTAWSVLDNFEWDDGYSLKFGLVNVDFEDPERTRTPKASASFYKKIIEDRGFPAP